MVIFCHTLTWISYGYTCVPHPERPSHLPPQSIPLGCPSVPALSALFHTLNLNWWSISHMVIYMFQCYSLKSSHPHFLPQTKKSVLYICVSFAVSHIGSSLSSFQIPDICVKFSSVQFSHLIHVQLFVTPWIAAHQASLSITNSRNLLKFMSFESVMPSSRLILCRTLLWPPIPPSIRVYTTQYICVNILYWGFSFWLTSLCIMGSSFIHLIRTGSNEFFLIAE